MACSCKHGPRDHSDVPNNILEEIFGNQSHNTPDPTDPEADFASDEEIATYVASLPPGTVFIDAEPTHREWHSAATQTMRTYIFGQGNEYTVLGPQLVHPTEDGGELVYDDSGQSHYIAAGFFAVTWSTKPGQPNFHADLL